MIIDQDSQFARDLILMEAFFEVTKKWASGREDLTKKEIIYMMKRVQGAAGMIEYNTKKAGTRYFEKVDE